MNECANGLTDSALIISDLVPIYNQQTPKVSKVDVFCQDLQKLADEILEFAKTCKTPRLAGLAANQLARGKDRLMVNMCVIMTENEDWIVAVNPEIYQHTEQKSWSREGCLTWQGKIVEAERFHNVSVKYQNLEGVQLFHGATGFEAFIWQHEINHLEGIKEKVVHPKSGKIYGLSVDGGNMVVNDKKIGRNDPCPCNSEKKYKKCCGK